MKCKTCGHEITQFGCTPGINKSVCVGDYSDCGCPLVLRLPDFGDQLADVLKAMEKVTRA